MTTDDGATAGGDARRPGTEPLPDDPAEIEALIARHRSDLASTIDELVVRAHPKEIARRSAADLQGRARAFATTEDGGLRVERLAAVAAAIVAVIGLLVGAKVRDRRRRRRPRLR
jgi:anti-sigma-K factor RskA